MHDSGLMFLMLAFLLQVFLQVDFPEFSQQLSLSLSFSRIKNLRDGLVYKILVCYKIINSSCNYLDHSFYAFPLFRTRLASGMINV